MGLRDNNKVHSILVESCGLQISDLKIHIGFFLVQGWFTAKQKKDLWVEMGATASRTLQVSNMTGRTRRGGGSFTRIRRKPAARGFRIKKRVQYLLRIFQKLRLKKLRELLYQGTSFRHRRLGQAAAQDAEFSDNETSSLRTPLGRAGAYSSDHDDESISCCWSLIPGLPKELAMQCLARVPRVLHGKMRAVCRTWRHMVESAEFLELRKHLGLSEDWLYLHVGTSPRLLEAPSSVGCRGGSSRWQLVGGFSLWHALDPFRYRWHALPPIPYDVKYTGGHVVLGASSVVFNGNLHVVGGAPFGRPALRDMWVYNPGKNQWRKSKPMLTPRFGCLLGVIGNKLYVVGGSGVCHITGYSLPCLEIYDPVTNTWQFAASGRGRVTTHPCSPLKHVAVVDNKLCVTGPHNLTGGVNSGMYDPELNLWTEIKPGLQSGWGKPSTMLDGKLYTIGFGCYQQYLPECDMWQPVKGQSAGTLLEWDPRLVSTMAASNGKLYMVGTMGHALIVVIAPVKDGQVSQSVRWHTMKLPNGIDFLGDLGYCSCQIISI